MGLDYREGAVGCAYRGYGWLLGKVALLKGLSIIKKADTKVTRLEGFTKFWPRR